MSIKPCIRCGSLDRYKDGRCKCCVKNRNEAYRRLHGVPVKEPKKIKVKKIKHPKEKKPRKLVIPKTQRKKGKTQTLAEISARRAIHSAKHKDKIAVVAALWRKENPESLKIHSNNRRALEKSASGILSIGLAEKLFKLQKCKCACCGKPLGDNYHLDHIMPLKLGGTNTDDNIQLLRASCNQRKSAKHPIDYMQSKGFLL